MNISSVISTYNLSNRVSNPVPMINKVGATPKEDYTESNPSEKTTSAKLQDSYEKAQPKYEIPLTYNQKGTLSTETSTTSQTNKVTTANSDIVALLDSKNSSANKSPLNIVSQYNSIKEGTAKADISSVLSNNPTMLYQTVNALVNSQIQSYGNYINTTA